SRWPPRRPPSPSGTPRSRRTLAAAGRRRPGTGSCELLVAHGDPPSSQIGARLPTATRAAARRHSPSLLDEEALDGLAADQVAVDDLLHVLDGDAAVPHLLRIDHAGDAALALVEAAGGVGADPLLQPALVQFALEGFAHR